MKTHQSAKGFWSFLLTVSLIGVLIGVLLIAIPTEFLIKLAFILLGIITLISAIPELASGLVNLSSREGKLSLVFSLISIAVGILMIFWHNSLLMVILGVYFLVFPLVEIIVAHDRKAALKRELPRMILGVVLLIVGPARTLAFLFDVAGWVVLALTAIYAIASAIVFLRRQKKSEQVTGSRIFVDQNGDGSIDSVIVDTTGDGKPDTERTYRGN